MIRHSVFFYSPFKTKILCESGFVKSLAHSSALGIPFIDGYQSLRSPSIRMEVDDKASEYSAGCQKVLEIRKARQRHKERMRFCGDFTDQATDTLQSNKYLHKKDVSLHKEDVCTACKQRVLMFFM